MRYGTWTIPQALVAETESAMRGRDHEVFALWIAALDVGAEYRDLASIERVTVPAQTPGITPHGVYVHIAGSELQRIQFDNYEHSLRSVVQLHTHPGKDVRMSDLDREWEVVAHVGALSIIVPNYCSRGLQLYEGAHVYEREDSDWRLWSKNEVAKRIRIV